MDIAALDKLHIVKFPDPVLKKRGVDVTEFGPPLRALAERMLELMRQSEGVGLAAPQVGLSLRLFVCNPTGEPEQDLVCVNPTLTGLDGAEDGPEGCLSIPGVTVNMRRAVEITVGLDRCRTCADTKHVALKLTSWFSLPLMNQGPMAALMNEVADGSIWLRLRTYVNDISSMACFAAPVKRA